MLGSSAVCEECTTQTQHRAPQRGKESPGGGPRKPGAFHGVPVPPQTTGHPGACRASERPWALSFLQNVPGPPACRPSGGVLRKRPWTRGHSPPGADALRDVTLNQPAVALAWLMNTLCGHGCWRKAFQLCPAATCLPHLPSPTSFSRTQPPGSGTVHPRCPAGPPIPGDAGHTTRTRLRNAPLQVALDSRGPGSTRGQLRSLAHAHCRRSRPRVAGRGPALQPGTRRVRCAFWPFEGPARRS